MAGHGHYCRQPHVSGGVDDGGEPGHRLQRRGGGLHRGGALPRRAAGKHLPWWRWKCPAYVGAACRAWYDTHVMVVVVLEVAVVQLNLFPPVQSTAGSLQSLCWASSAVGGVASAYFSGSLVCCACQQLPNTSQLHAHNLGAVMPQQFSCRRQMTLQHSNTPLCAGCNVGHPQRVCGHGSLPAAGLRQRAAHR